MHPHCQKVGLHLLHIPSNGLLLIPVYISCRVERIRESLHVWHLNKYLYVSGMKSFHLTSHWIGTFDRKVSSAFFDRRPQYFLLSSWFFYVFSLCGLRPSSMVVWLLHTPIRYLSTIRTQLTKISFSMYFLEANHFHRVGSLHTLNSMSPSFAWLLSCGSSSTWFAVRGEFPYSGETCFTYFGGFVPSSDLKAGISYFVGYKYSGADRSIRTSIPMHSYFFWLNSLL